MHRESEEDTFPSPHFREPIDWDLIELPCSVQLDRALMSQADIESSMQRAGEVPLVRVRQPGS